MGQIPAELAARSCQYLKDDVRSDECFHSKVLRFVGHACAHRVSGIATACMAVLMGCNSWAVADELPPGEIPFASVKDKRPQHLRLLSGKLFRMSGRYSQTSVDGGKTWQQGGQVNPLALGWKLNGVAIQLQRAKYRGRIVVPFYFGMYGRHPDYTTTARGGYAIWKGKKILLETHTHIPEMSGSFVCLQRRRRPDLAESCVSQESPRLHDGLLQGRPHGAHDV